MAGEGEGVKLLGNWASPYALRVLWALKLKGIEFECTEEDVHNKSALLLRLNPVYKKIPVLVHNGKPVAESLVILEYIEETWKDKYPLLPQDPYQRALARFWAKFVDEKGEEQEKSLREAGESLKTLESGLEGKRFFGGERIGFVDVAAAWIGIWGLIIGEIVKKELIDEESMPLLCAWLANVLETPIIKECVPAWDKLLAYCVGAHQRLTVKST